MQKHRTLDIQERLRRAGLRATRQRIEVLHALMSAKSPLSVETLTRSSSANYDVATAYRILDAFTDAGLAKKVELAQGRSFYELEGDHHHHAICTTCGTISDIHACLPKGLDEEVRKAARFSSIEEHTLDFFGTCASCAKKYV